MPILLSVHNKHVVWSVDSVRKDPHSWCDFDNPATAASTTPFGRKEARIIEMSPSNQFDAVIQMDKKGIPFATLFNM